MCFVFSVSDKHGQRSNVNWLSTSWLLIFRQEVANKKPLFTKPAITWIGISCEKDIIFHGYKILHPTPGCYTGKMLFFNVSKIIKKLVFNTSTWYFLFICNLPKWVQRKDMNVIWALDAIYICLCTNLCTYLFTHLCERKKSFIKIPTLILYLKL